MQFHHWITLTVLGTTLILMTEGCCSTTVALRIENPSGSDLDVTISRLDSEGRQKQVYRQNSIPNNQSMERKLEMRPGDDLVVAAQLPGSVEVFRDSYTLTSADPDPLKRVVKLQVRRPRPTSNPEAIFKTAFDILGRKIDIEPIPVANALRTIFGGLAVVDTSTVPPKVVTMVYAQELKAETKPAEFHFPTRSSAQTLEISGKVAASMKASVPLVAALNATFQSEDLYQLRWEVKNYGPVMKENPASWSIGKALRELPPETKKNLERALASKSNELLWINKIVVVEAAFLETKKGKKLGVGADIAASQFVSGQFAYAFDESVEDKTLVGSCVLNLGATPVFFEDRPKAPDVAEQIELFGSKRFVLLLPADAQKRQESLAERSSHLGDLGISEQSLSQALGSYLRKVDIDSAHQ